MPVIRISASVDCSTNSGAGLWMGEVRVAPISPRPSMGSPSRFQTRPRHSSPTGTEMGALVLSTLVPR